MTTTPEMIREIRTRNGWTQQHLGEVLGVTTSTVARWEAGVFAVGDRHEPALADLWRTRGQARASSESRDALLAAGGPEALAAADAGAAAMDQAERMGLRPLAMWLAGQAHESHANGQTAAQFLSERRRGGLPTQERDIDAITSAGIWPWCGPH